MSLVKRVLSLIPKKASREERTFYSELLKSVETNTAKPKDVLDAKESIYEVLDAIGSPVDAKGNVTVEFPQTPEGFTVNAAFNNVVLEWEAPNYNGHAFAEIFRADVDDLAVAEANGVWLRAFTSIIGDAVDAGTTHYYWVRFVNKIGQVGAFNSPAGTEGTTSVPVEQMIAELGGRITSSELAQELAEPIGKIPALEVDLSSVATDVIDNYAEQLSGMNRLTLVESDVSNITSETIPLIQADINTGQADILSKYNAQNQEIADARAIAENNSGDLINSVMELSDAYAKEAQARRESLHEVQNYINAAITVSEETGQITLDAMQVYEDQFNTSIANINQDIDVLERKFTLKVSQTDVDAMGNQTLSAVNDEILARSGICSLSDFTDAASCIANGGQWTLSSLAEEKKTLVALANSAETNAKAYADTQTQAVATDLQAEVTRTDNLKSSLELADTTLESLITTESNTRATQDTALANQITALQASVSGNESAIVTEQTARATEDTALAGEISTLRASTATDKNELLAAIQSEANTRTTAISAETDQREQAVSALETADTSLQGLINTESTTRATADLALGTRIDTVQAEVVDTATALVQAETTARTTAIDAEATARETLQSELQGEISTVQQGAYTKNEVDKTVAGLSTLVSVSSNEVDIAESLIQNALEGANEKQGRRTNNAIIYRHEEARKTADESLASEISLLRADTVTDKNEVMAAIQSESEVRTTAISAETTQREQAVSSLQTADSNLEGLINTESTTRATETEALGSRIDTVQANVDTTAAQIQAETRARATAIDAEAAERLALKTVVDNNSSAITSESLARTTEDAALSSSIDALQTIVDGNTAAIVNESTTRSNEDEALATQITLLKADTVTDKAEVLAAVTEEQKARTTAVSAETTERKAAISSLETEDSRISGLVATESSTRATQDGALSDRITQIKSQVENPTTGLASKASLTQMQTAESNAKSSAVGDVKQLLSEMELYDTQTQTSKTVSALADERINSVVTTDAQGNITNLSADSVKSVQIDDGAGNLATVQQTFQAQKTDINKSLVSYGVKLDVNGYVTGFAQNNDGKTGSFYIRADEFAIIDPASNTNSASLTAQQKEDATPFMVTGGKTYIKNAYIKDLTTDNIAANAITADKINVADLSAVSANLGSIQVGNANIQDGAITDAKIANTIQSANYSSGNSGWIIDKSGYAEFYDTVIRGTLDGATINGGVIRGATIIFTSQLRATEAGEPFYVYGVPASSFGSVLVKDIYNYGWNYGYTGVFGFYAYNAKPDGTGHPEHYATKRISIDLSGGGQNRGFSVRCRGVRIYLYTSTDQYISTIFDYSAGKRDDWTSTQNGITVSRDYWEDPDGSESGSGEESVKIDISGTYTFDFSGYDNKKFKVKFGLLDLVDFEGYSLTASTSTG